jgi:hypothetical protein
MFFLFLLEFSISETCDSGHEKNPLASFAGGLGCFLLISLAVYFRPWQSAGMEFP